jgi:hypothetical protein
MPQKWTTIPKQKPEFFILNKTKRKHEGQIMNTIPDSYQIDQKSYMIPKKKGFTPTGMVFNKDRSVEVYYKKKEKR